MRSRSWRWVRTRILGLLTVPAQHDMNGNPIHGTRLAAVLAPPPQQQAPARGRKR